MAVLAALLAVLLAPAGAQAAVYYSVAPGKEFCADPVIFGDNGGGEYTLTAEDPGYPERPWTDNHFTSLMASENNRVIVPVCFSTVGRAVPDSANIRITVSTPRDGNITYDYGLCIASGNWQVNVIEGEASGDACKVIAGHTEVFSAALDQPEQYASPGEDVTYVLLLDSSNKMTVGITRASDGMEIKASSGTAELGSGQQKVELTMTAPGKTGSYAFSVMVAVKDCAISDCRREVRGTLRVVAEADKPKASFYMWLKPETKSVIGQESTEFTISVRNYGPGQKLTAYVSADEGLDTDFSPYTFYLEKDASKLLSFSATPATAERKSYEIRASVEGENGAGRSAKAWLTVDEMVADALLLGEDGFVDEYDAKGGAALADWEGVKSVTGSATSKRTETEGEPGAAEPLNVVYYVIIGVVVAVVIVLLFIIYRKTKVEGTAGPSWKDIGA
jgi:hypothetical protein